MGARMFYYGAYKCWNISFVSDVAVFVLKRDVKLQPTNRWNIPR